MASALRTMDRRRFDVDDRSYEVYVRREIENGSAAPRLVVVSRLPNETAFEMLEACLNSIRRYTAEDHELWVVDNASSEAFVRRLAGFRGINLVCNRSRHVDDGSYDNGLGLELAARIIDPASRYLMSLHQDTLVCKSGWLGTMLSKMDHSVRGVGVRRDTARVKRGVLHVLGCLIDFQLYRELGLSFLPRLPQYDAGDRVIAGFYEAGYDVYAFPNSLHEPELVRGIPDGSPLKALRIDRTFDDAGSVFFLHLGRGVLKAGDQADLAGKTSAAQWLELAREHVLGEADPAGPGREAVRTYFADLGYSVRRYFVDEFFLREAATLPPADRVLDLGGKKTNKRGRFDIGLTQVDVLYANLDAATDPDYRCDVRNVPEANGSFDVVICSEVLEHVADPEAVLREARRLLKAGGVLLVTVPFLFRIHADPEDHARYTDHHWREVLERAGFDVTLLEKHGLFFSVLAGMVWDLVRNSRFSRGSVLGRRVCTRFIAWLRSRALVWDARPPVRNADFVDKYTTGFGIKAVKR